MIKIGERVVCVDRSNYYFGKEGVFIGWLANGLRVKFDNGKESLFLPSSLKKVEQE